MDNTVDPGDWVSLDAWWSAYSQIQALGRPCNKEQLISNEWLTSYWKDLDSWWQQSKESSTSFQTATSPQVLGLDQLVDQWDELDPWWSRYSETGSEKASKISEWLSQSNDEWKTADAPFRMDPLAADLTQGHFLRGPLQPSNEMAWSQWFTQLLGQSPGLVTEVFDVVVEQAPSKIVREEQLSKEDGSFRRPDILVFHADHGISIEVKLGDENYPKTAETANLVERFHDERNWTHTLLLPEEKKHRLDSIVDVPVESQPDGQLQVKWDDPGPVNVLFWRDVTAAIRSILRQDAVVDDHWAANAYLFCAVAEQQIMEFHPQPVVERLATPTDVVDTKQPMGIADKLEEQLRYLHTRADL